MKRKSVLTVLCVLALSGCAEMQTGPDSPPSPYAGRMNAASDQYLACISREAEKDMKNPAGAEDIATAAHGRCWSAWEAYRGATNADFSYGARTPDEMQFGRDKAEAHLRQFEREARRAIVERVIERSRELDKPR